MTCLYPIDLDQFPQYDFSMLSENSREMQSQQTMKVYLYIAQSPSMREMGGS